MTHSKITLLGEHWRTRAQQAVSQWTAVAANAAMFAERKVRLTAAAARPDDIADSGETPWAAFTRDVQNKYSVGPDARSSSDGVLPRLHDGFAPEKVFEDAGLQPIPSGLPAPLMRPQVDRADQDGRPTRPLCQSILHEAAMARAEALDPQADNRLQHRDAVVEGVPPQRAADRRMTAATKTVAGTDRRDVDLRDQQTKIGRSSYGVVNRRLKAFLGNLLKIRVPNVRLYDNPAADRIARTFNADAVTYDDKILFRTGTYRPQDPDGLALLGHELTHAAANSQWPAARQSAVEPAEEQRALQNEATVLHHVSTGDPIQPDPRLASAPRPAGAAPVRRTPASAVMPKAAESGRDLGFTAQAPLSAPQTSDSQPLSPRQLSQVYDYLKAKVREEGERIGV